jgi:hypothetical protein
MGTGDPVASWIGDGPALCPAKQLPRPEAPGASRGFFFGHSRRGITRPGFLDSDGCRKCAYGAAKQQGLDVADFVRRDPPQAYSRPARCAAGLQLGRSLKRFATPTLRRCRLDYRRVALPVTARFRARRRGLEAAAARGTQGKVRPAARQGPGWNPLHRAHRGRRSCLPARRRGHGL